MAKQSDPELPGANRVRYEFRVWGRHGKARKALRKLADSTVEEHVEDCYLITDDPTWNVKVRGSRLKLKLLVKEERGFEQWASGRYQRAKDVPHPFDVLFDALGLDRLVKGKAHDLRGEVERRGAELGVRAVFVTKHRTRYRIGPLRAEVTDIDVEDGELLQTLLIEGDDLAELRSLQKSLGLRGEPNEAVHDRLDD